MPAPLLEPPVGTKGETVGDMALADLTVAELKLKLSALGIVPRSKDRKPELVALLSAAAGRLPGRSKQRSPSRSPDPRPAPVSPVSPFLDERETFMPSIYTPHTVMWGFVCAVVVAYLGFNDSCTRDEHIACQLCRDNQADACKLCPPSLDESCQLEHLADIRKVRQRLSACSPKLCARAPLEEC